MDKIKKFENWISSIYGKSIGGTEYTYASMQNAYDAGRESADLLPTEKVCPECIDGEIKDDESGLWIDCGNCDGKGTIPLYYTPKQYEKIMDKPFSDDASVWCLFAMKYLDKEGWYLKYYGTSQGTNWPTYIVQTNQPAPPADYRPEE